MEWPEKIHGQDCQPNGEQDDLLVFAKVLHMCQGGGEVNRQLLHFVQAEGVVKDSYSLFCVLFFDHT